MLHWSLAISKSVSLILNLSLLTFDPCSYLYQFQKLGDDDNEPEFSSTSYSSFGMSDPTLPLPRAYFRPRGLDNLALADELESLDPIVDAKVMNILPNSDTPQIFTV